LAPNETLDLLCRLDVVCGRSVRDLHLCLLGVRGLLWMLALGRPADYGENPEQAP
jgi:hypothetical protein